MKLTILFSFIWMLQVSASVYSQATKFSFSFENKQVVDVLRELETNSDFRFFYQREQLDLDRRVNLDIENKSIEQILDEVFADQGVSYTIMKDNLIVIKAASDPSVTTHTSQHRITSYNVCYTKLLRTYTIVTGNKHIV